MKSRLLRVLFLSCVAMVAGILVDSGCGAPPLAPLAGIFQYQAPAWVQLPLGRLNVAGGNHLIERIDFSIDTRLGTRNVGATWNSATADWHWSFDLRYFGTSFTDASGAVHDLTGVAPGAAIPGTQWRLIDATRLKTKGGLVHEFDANGELSSIHWSSGAQPSLQFRRGTVAGTDVLTSVDQCTTASSCSLLYSITYDASARLSSIHDRAGRATAYFYDTGGLLTEVRDTLANARGVAGSRYSYGTGGQLQSVITPDGEQFALTELARRLISLKQVGLGDPTWSFSYGTPSGGTYTTQVTNPLGNTGTFRYDAMRRIVEMQRPLGESISMAWNGLRVASITDAAGTSVSITFADDDPATIVQSNGNTLHVTYQPSAENRAAPAETAVSSVTDDLGTLVQRSFDTAGRLVTETNGAGETTTLAWNATGELTTLTGPNGIATTLSGYGEHGHATQVGVAGQQSTSMTSFDSVGNPLTLGQKDPLPGAVSRAYDEGRNLLEVVLSDSPADTTLPGTLSTLHIDSRLDGRPLAIHRPNGGDTVFVYDVLGRLVESRELADGTWHSTFFTRDALGRVVSAQRANGMRVDRTYDADGRLASIVRSQSGVVDGTATFQYAQDRLTSIQDYTRTGPESFQYDATGELWRTVYPDGEALERSFDARSRVTQERFLVGGSALRTLDYAYDAAGRDASVTEGGNALLQRSFASGRLSQVTYGNGLTRAWAYNPTTGLVVSTSTLDSSGAYVENTSFIVLPAQSAFYIQESSVLGGITTQESDLTSAPAGSTARRRVSSGGVGATEGFAFDAESNLTTTMTSSNGTTSTQTLVYNPEHNRLNEIQDASGTPLHTYTWDAAGFATSRDGVPLTWTGDGRIASVGTDLQVKWDLSGRPAAVTVAGVRLEARFGGRMMADASGQLVSFEIAGGRVEEDLQTGAHTYRHMDYRGNVAFETDDAGQLLATHSYLPFGPASPGFAKQSFVRAQQLGDLVWIGPRILDPAAGAFLAPDPIPNLVNQYTYAFGNPIELQDPSGMLSAEQVGDIAFNVKLAGAGVLVAGIATEDIPLGATGAALLLLGHGLGTPVTRATMTADILLTSAAVITAIKQPVVAGLLASFPAGQALRVHLRGGVGGVQGLGGGSPNGGGVPAISEPSSATVPSDPFCPDHSNGSTGGGFSGFSGGGGGGGGGGFCTPQALITGWHSAIWILILLPLETLLAVLVLRSLNIRRPPRA